MNTTQKQIEDKNILTIMEEVLSSVITGALQQKTTSLAVISHLWIASLLAYIWDGHDAPIVLLTIEFLLLSLGWMLTNHKNNYFRKFISN